jgi:hypothetical protein
MMVWNWMHLRVNGYITIRQSSLRDNPKAFKQIDSSCCCASTSPNNHHFHLNQTISSSSSTTSPSSSSSSSKGLNCNSHHHHYHHPNHHPNKDNDNSRRRALQTILAVATTAATMPTKAALAGVAEVDTVTGELYSPKAEMLRGGSAAARGLNNKYNGARLKPGQAFQNVYDTRFITYLARFLLTVDTSAHAWWRASNQDETTFAEFAESVEIGLADYFVGPYGSYSSLQAMTAGIDASVQAKSSRFEDSPRSGFFPQPKKQQQQQQQQNRIAKQGVLNLYALLKARYTSIEEKKQLAILFSFFSVPEVQPTAEIRGLFGEVDNASITDIQMITPVSFFEPTSRNSSRRGGGYGPNEVPQITVDSPPALGASYKAAQVRAKMKATSRVLRIKLLDGGAGYTQAPTITIVGKYIDRPCVASAILDREGHVDEIIVLDPGYGYSSGSGGSLKVIIAAPRKFNKQKEPLDTEKPRPARAMAELEYEVDRIDVVQGGNGFVSSEPPKVVLTPPQQDPDWYVGHLKDMTTLQALSLQVSQMKDSNGNLIDPTITATATPQIQLDRLRNDPLELLPSFVRPQLNSYDVYVIPKIAAIPTYNTSPNPRYRAFDPVFGAIGKVPVTKSALELRPDEYARLAVSGAVCTVLVRTALNPLELIKTKLQLQNDEELIQFTKQNLTLKQQQEQQETPSNAKEEASKIGSLDLIQNLASLRGPFALFQSADITFLASLMFGSFGFGATELFRRSFSISFFSIDGGDSNSEVILLLAATAATIITSAAAAPFELLRVRSMGLVESKPWTQVLGDFIQEKASNGGTHVDRQAKDKSTTKTPKEFSLKDIQAKDLLPLFAGFPPTASRELAFAIPKFLAFDILSKTITVFINSKAGPGSLPIQVGIGSEGLFISAISGALAGIAGGIISHPADLILTYTSASKKKKTDSGADWRDVVKDLLQKEGGIKNLFVGLQPRLVFFFLVIGLQFFLYDYVKILLQVGSDDLSLVLDVFYAVRQGLVESMS